MPPSDFIVSTTDVMDLTTIHRYAVCERDSRHVVIEKRSSGTSHHMTYRTEKGADGGLNRARVVLRDTALMVVDREAE
jgi:hypothetical protein